MTAPKASPAVIVLGPAQGEMHSMVGDTVLLKLSGAQTAGTCALLFETAPPGGGPPPHKHVHEDEIFLVLEGQFEFWSETGVKSGGPGTVMFGPRGVAHTFRNIGTGPGRVAVFVTPAGFENFFREASAPTFEENLAKVQAAAPRYGIEILPPPPAQ